MSKFMLRNIRKVSVLVQHIGWAKKASERRRFADIRE